MGERTPEIEVSGGQSVRGEPRRLTLTPGQPGMVALTIYVRDKPYTVVVSLAQLRTELDRMDR